jgi:hypothetical protein
MYMRIRKATRKRRLKRKAFFVDERTLKRARKALGAVTEAEAVRLALEQAAEMADFRKFMTETRATLAPGSFETP